MMEVLVFSIFDFQLRRRLFLIYKSTESLESTVEVNLRAFKLLGYFNRLINALTGQMDS